MSDCRYIFIKGAKAKNLKNIDIDILRSKRKEFLHPLQRQQTILSCLQF